MKNKFTILGCGSSLGTPWITNYWGSCNKNNTKNIRTRCSAHIQYENQSILIDTSPDIKAQFKKNKINNVDAVIYTHGHADQTSGIFELRPFFWKNNKRIPIFGSRKTISSLKKSNGYCFKSSQGYVPICKENIIKNRFSIKKKKSSIKIQSFEVQHGMIKSTAYVFEKIAYISDANKIPRKYLKYLFNLDLLVLDCLKYSKHPSHFNYEEALNLSKMLNPKKTIFTNLHTELDYSKLKNQLPKSIVPAYDGLSFSF
jgi:phosphoribosyl 1,2-cyclic phosphate phosphodiesterase